MGSRGGLLGVVDIAVARAIDPELAHRDIAVFLAKKLIRDGRHADPGSLGRETHPVIMGEFLGAAVMHLGQKVGKGAAVVPEETLRLLHGS